MTSVSDESSAVDGDIPSDDGATLRVPRCRHCDRWFWYPRARCPYCRSADIELVGSRGTGTLYTYSTLPTGTKASAGGAGDRVLGYVELDEGPFVLATLVGVSPDEVRIGMPLTALPPEGEQPLRFRSTTSAEGAAT
jgi:uncharacterized OB-fold protein